MTIRKNDRNLNTNGEIDSDNYYTKSQINSQMNTKADKSITADTSLSNLSADGQMIVDSQNGTISNCILDIPQNIKLSLENNVLTLKSGSILTKTGDTYATVTTTQDITFTVSGNDNGYVIFSNNSRMQMIWKKYIGSGSTLPSDSSNYYYFYNTTDKLLYHWVNNSWSTAAPGYYPICLIEILNGVATFAKDSNGNDMIFNGAGFIGHHAFVYPNVKALIPAGFNEDGSMKSSSRTQNALIIKEITSGSHMWMLVGANNYNLYSAANYYEVSTYKDIIPSAWTYFYVNDENRLYSVNGSSVIDENPTVAFFKVTYDGTTVTDFAIRQPVRTATTEMLDSATTKAKTYKGTYNATVQYYAGDIVKSGSVFYEALQDNINVVVTENATWSQLSEDHKVKYYERSDNTEFPIGLTGSSASGTNYSGYMYFTTHNKPTINASTGVITATGGIIGKTEAAGDNSTKYATTAFVNGYLASITGYNATKTQTLKNVSGTLTWVDD